MNDFKLIIFDLDGTLYDLNDVVSMNYQMQVDFFSSYEGLSNADTIEVFEEHCIFPTMNEKSKSATEFFINTGISAKEWNDYRESHFNVDMINKESAVSFELIKKYNKSFSLVLLSSNSKRNIVKILDHLNIPESVFIEIICSDQKHDSGPFSKIKEMRLLIQRMSLVPELVLSIGDRKKTDVDPILELGGHGVVISNPKALSQLLDDLHDCKSRTNKYYQYY